MPMELEVCVDELSIALEAAKFPIQRMEICSALGEGGLSPEPGLVAIICEKLKAIHKTIMIRPRSGAFIYSDEEWLQMEKSIAFYSQFSIQGFVIGALNEDGTIDGRLKNLIQKYSNYEWVFHRAIDEVSDYLASLDELSSMGFSRVLTSGHASNVDKGIAYLSSINHPIEIMIGGGVNSSNFKVLCQLPIQAIHFSAHKSTKKTIFGLENSLDEKKLKTLCELNATNSR